MENILPSSLYACKSLVILKLRGDIRLDVPRVASLPSLKTLHLDQNNYLDGESLGRFLSVCPVLEDLLVRWYSEIDDMGFITVMVPSLQSLSLYIPPESLSDGLVINTPSLKYLKLEDFNVKSHSCLIENMPNLGEAYVDVRFPDIKNLIRGITLVKRLALCAEEAVYGGGFVFDQLEHLKLCVCEDNSSNLRDRLLEDSPNLRVLDIFIMDHYYSFDSFGEPTNTVPECILSSLQKYLGRPQEKDLVVYIFGKCFSLKDCNNLL